MSPTMFLGRVVLPAAGLIVAISLALELGEKVHGPDGTDQDRSTLRVRTSKYRTQSSPRAAWSPLPAPR